MDLSKAIALDKAETLAFVGDGGKTDAMFALARLLPSPVIITTTTHLDGWQVSLADEHRIIQSIDDVEGLDFTQERILLLTGPFGKNNHLMGLEESTLDSLHTFCQRMGVPLLIDGDEARHRSLKAPADNEPVIPTWVDKVVVMAGLQGLGKPLHADYVHRPEYFSLITGLHFGEKIEVEHLIKLLKSDLGGLKGIPLGAQRILFLNQAEGSFLSAKAGQIARALVDHYDKVLIGSLHAANPNEVVSCVHVRTAGVILAAGGSERLGTPKQLLDWQGKPFIQNVVQNALEAGLEPLAAVTGADNEMISASLSTFPVKIVHNPDWKSGQASSMQVGLGALPKNCDSVMFLLCDQPQISADLIRQLVDRYAQNRLPITAPLIRDQRGNPVLFSRETFKALMKVEGDQGGRAVFSQFNVDWLPWIDERDLMDVDEMGDLEMLRSAYFLSN